MTNEYLNENDNCPECDGEVKDLIAYVRGRKTSDGYKCKEWEVVW